ncbi:MAG: polysaccharide pyruvyl transferase family protein [Rhizobiaceae bacterium]|nr:polysaccharide pyruvyl transferase family protein [Rhizobiaceae bacterium]MCZ8352366.1 polysaccharide pyruvyl transferase family protein [Rhizobium sp.]
MKSGEMRKRKIFLFARTQFENVGDAVINRELALALRKFGALDVYLGRCPTYFRNGIALDNVDGVNVRRLSLMSLLLHAFLSRLNYDSTYIFFAPGGKKSELSLPKYTANLILNYAIAALSLFGIRCVLFGVSYENLGKRHQKILKQRAVMLAAHVVRDNITADYLRQCGVNYTAVASDLAFLIPPVSKTRSEAGFVCFSFRIDNSKYDKQRFVELVRQIAVFDQRRILFLCQVVRDRDFMSDLYRSFEERMPGRCLYLDISERAQDYRNVFDGCDVMFSNRLHALLLSASRGVKPVAITTEGHDMKIRGIYEYLGMNEFLFDGHIEDENLLRLLSLKFPETLLLSWSRSAQLIEDRLANVFNAERIE